MSHGRDRVRPGDERRRLQPPDGPEPGEHREEESRAFLLLILPRKLVYKTLIRGDSEQGRAAAQVTPGF